MSKVKTLNQAYAMLENEINAAKSFFAFKDASELLIADAKEELSKAKSGIDPKETDDHGRTALHVAARHGDVDYVIDLVTSGADVDAEDEFKWTPLHLTKNSKIIESLVRAGANIEARNCEGKTPLSYACMNASIEAISKLLELGASLEARDTNGHTPLQNAATYNHLSTVTLLLEHGAKPQEVFEEGFYTSEAVRSLAGEHTLPATDNITTTGDANDLATVEGDI